MISNMSLKDQVIERGIQAALSSTITDQVHIPDFYDYDLDGRFTPPGDITDADSADDYIGRFAFYNYQRLAKIDYSRLEGVERFINGLREFLYEGDDGWGLYDPPVCPGAHVCCSGSSAQPAECDPCCVPENAMDYEGNTVKDEYGNPVRIRPECCDSGSCDFPTGVPASSCAVRSPFTNGIGYKNQYPWVYDASYEDTTNIFESFREKMGRDDEHHLFRVNKDELPWHSSASEKQIFDPPGSDPHLNFFITDATGFYDKDDQTGIFPFFHAVSKWGTELKNLSYSEDECHWCDPGVGTVCTVYPYVYQVPDQLVLPDDPAAMSYNGGWCVDSENTGQIGEPPQLADKVPLPGKDGPANNFLFADPDECATNWDDGWKPGADLYCSLPVESTVDTYMRAWPYYMGCDKNRPGECENSDGVDSDGNPLPVLKVDCECGEGTTDAREFPEDALDMMISGMGEFVVWASELVKGDMDSLKMTLNLWYQEAAQLIEPPCPGGNCPNSFTDNEAGGSLFFWWEGIKHYRDKIGEWLNPAAADLYVSNSCLISGTNNDTVWCVPPTQTGVFNEHDLEECPGVTQDELDTFEGTNGVRGDLDDVVACLDWNANSSVNYDVGEPTLEYLAIGNADKFDACAVHCNAERCAELPRSLVPGFNSNPEFFPFVPPNEQAENDLSRCLASVDVEECDDKCASLCSTYGPSGDGTFPDLCLFDAPDLTQLARLTLGGDLYDFCVDNPGDTSGTYDCCDGFSLVCGDGVTEPPVPDDCLASCERSCSGWGKQFDTTYYDKVADALIDAGGTCSHPAFEEAVAQSAAEARNQVAKFRKRHDFLSRRLTEAKNIYDIFSVAAEKFEEFLTNGTPWNTTYDPDGTPDSGDEWKQDSPAEELIQARIDNEEDNDNSGTASVAIYAWQDPPRTTPRASGGYGGYWHIVKVETRCPQRCGAEEACGDDEWPHVETVVKKSSWKAKMCHYMMAPSNFVKTRVIRWDEDKDPFGLTFPGGAPIWSMRFSHPKDIAGGGGSGGEIYSTCLNQVDPYIQAMKNGPASGAGWERAFMLDRPPIWDEADPEYDREYEECWQKVHEFLSGGVESVSCARYKFSASSGFSIRTIGCDQEFIKGNN